MPILSTLATPAIFMDTLQKLVLRGRVGWKAAIAKQWNSSSPTISQFSGLMHMLLGNEPNTYDDDTFFSVISNTSLASLIAQIGVDKAFKTFEKIKEENPEFCFQNISLLKIYEVYNSKKGSLNSGSYALGTFHGTVQSNFINSPLPITLESFLALQPHVVANLSFKDLSLNAIKEHPSLQDFCLELLRQNAINATRSSNSNSQTTATPSSISTAPLSSSNNSLRDASFEDLEGLTLRELHHAILNINYSLYSIVISSAALQNNNPRFFRQPTSLIVNSKILNDFLIKYDIKYDSLQSLITEIAEFQFFGFYDQTLSQASQQIQSLLPHMTYSAEQTNIQNNLIITPIVYSQVTNSNQNRGR